MTKNEATIIWNQLMGIRSVLEAICQQLMPHIDHEGAELEIMDTDADCEHPQEALIATTGMGGSKASYYCSKCEAHLVSSGGEA